jgi:hypothetical protein
MTRHAGPNDTCIRRAGEELVLPAGMMARTELLAYSYSTLYQQVRSACSHQHCCVIVPGRDRVGTVLSGMRTWF